MDLERVAAVIRPRSPWEAVDLGFSMVRAWWRPVFAPWVAATLPVWVAVLLLGRSRPAWALLALWWLKPAFDRLPLYVVSRALFGDLPRVRETLRAALSLKGLLAPLTRERLNPARAFDLPVRQLEGFRGRALRERRRVLRGGGDGPAKLLTVACGTMELVSVLALGGLVAFLIPESAGPRWGELGEAYLAGGAPLWFHLLAGLCWWAAVALVEPFYVAGGFALYLNRRTLLEGWDVEIAFRRLARRLAVEETEGRRSRRAAAPARPRPAMLLVAALLGSVAAAPAGAAPAAGAPAAAVAPAAVAGASPGPQELIAEILAEPEFGTRQKVRVWRLRWVPPVESLGGIGGLGGVVAVVAEVALWLAVGAALAAVLVYLARTAGRRTPAHRRSAAPAPRPGPIRSGRLDSGESLPADIAASALRRLEAGQPLTALSLLYRGTLAALDRRPGLTVRESWTETECLGQLAAQLPVAVAHYLRRVTLAWQRAAYAHRGPAETELRALCGEWPLHFGTSAP